MSLFKQVSIVLSFIFTILFILITVVSFKIIKDSTEKSLYENVQNSVTSISLSITNAGTDLGSIKTVINASFDNGNYEKIIFRDMNEVSIYETSKEIEPQEKDIPTWFINFVDIGEVSAKATISKGWNVLGTIEIYNDRSIFYQQTYGIFKNLIYSLLISFSILTLILFFLFGYILRPLKIIKKQANAVMKNEFIIQEKLPFTTEFKSVTLSINSMINKIEKMFENTNTVLKLNNELLYIDEVSKLHNRKYLRLKVNEFLEKENPNNQGIIAIISLKIDELNKKFGYVKTNDILLNFANIMKKEFENDSNIMARINGSEFVILSPDINKTDMKESISKFIKDLHEKVELLKDEIFIGLFKYEEEQNAKILLTKMDYVISQAKTFHEQDYYFIEDIDNCLTKEEWIKIINISLEKDYFKLLYRDIVDIDLKNVLYKTISFELNYENNNFSYKGLIPSILALGRLNEIYLYIIERILRNNEKENRQITIQLPKVFVIDFNNYSKLKELFIKYKSFDNKNLIFEIEEESFNKNLENTTMYINLFKKYSFGFAVFNFIANSTDYFYLKELKPLYIKASKYFLLESAQSLSVLKILTQSLDIKLIATSVNSIDDIEVLSNLGINAICGSVMQDLNKGKS
ncbi:EAL domain-containing protein [Poseidonibacter lekithochrous]|uniref:LapD/MoxY N-terminal periplasmic domain-containing protein n=1 Tax=Poseidonibacter TaxID=2321187 RepID=UPI001C09B687|nr:MULTISPECIES: LapD/MoxY N-terminal periplasmic domain-containing protein [Poseidonibacter]MBU3014040.1 EAL domain-containing protein [Poseidonibacter lekithochrous]MDO6827336.1 LapD/MoxY N-terminal periplasmic domain-containing protein [Poseidonibacter sp. 1_MG-2023]